METQTKNQIIAEITTTTVKTIKQTTLEFERTLPEDFVDKINDEAVKRIKSSRI